MSMGFPVLTVADPGFFTQSGCANLLFCKYFARNCMKIKEFEPQGVHIPGAPLNPPMSKLNKLKHVHAVPVW